jgi:hypothetical protein
MAWQSVDKDDLVHDLEFDALNLIALGMAGAGRGKAASGKSAVFEVQAPNDPPYRAIPGSFARLTTAGLSDSRPFAPQLFLL